MLQRICVFCGSNPGHNGAYQQAATELGRLLAAEGIGLVYGGGRVGIMGTLADAALAGGGQVIGILPAAMNRPGIPHPGLTELHIVDSMHNRKATMIALSDAFIALPGGMGTLDELFETLTLSQLGYQPKPIGILNVAGYYDPLLVMIEHAIEHGFVRPQHRGIFAVAEDPAILLSELRRFLHPAGSKWTTLDPD